MLFQTLAVLAISASALAHPHSNNHRHPLKPSGSANVVAPSGGMYGMGNSTYGSGTTGTGFATGTSVVRTGTAPASTTELVVDPAGSAPEPSIDTAVAQASDLPSDVSACMPGFQSTTTIYSTDLVTLTVTAEDTITVRLSSVSASNVASSYASSNITATSAEETETSVAAAAPSGASSEVSTVVVVSTSEAETPPASSAALISSEVTPTTTASTTATTDFPAASSEETSSSSTMNAPGGFYEASVSAPAPVSSSAPSTGSYAGGKRGLAYNSAQLTNAFAGQSMSWAYNWAAGPDGTLDSGIEFVPMLWGQKTFGGWETAVESALAAGAQHLLSFNEPDLSAQANMDSATAAAAHIELMNPYAGRARIGSPAVTNGGPTGGTDGMGLGWLRNFFDQCGGNCRVDFLTFHWYDSADNVAYFKNYVQDVIDLANENGIDKVWLTEFAASGSDEQVAEFLGEVLPWMDSNDAIERYAYFMCSEGELVSGTSMSDPVGRAYAA